MVFFFRDPLTVKKYINNAGKNASCYEAIFVLVGINTIWLFHFVICPINDTNLFRLNFVFDRFLKYLFSLYYDGGLINSYPCFLFCPVQRSVKRRQ